ncbi:MAG: DUF1844 domain-containing protein [Myxococcota bacterium]|nr:DUF1844 domain-containing protein [Myxococcota bacterium]
MPPSADHDDDHVEDDAGLGPLPGGDGAPPIDFTTFILSMSTSCMIHLGEIAAPEGGTSVDLEAARHTIEILQMLDRKTEGQLSGEEDRMLSHVIDDLRTRYLARHSAKR